MSENAMSSKSTSASPDLDWSQVRETVLMLKLAAAQVEYSLRDGNNSVDALAGSFTSMADGIGEIDRSFKNLKATHAIEDDSITALCETISGKMQHAIVAFQFYDKLVQRLDHVVGSLSQLGDLVGNASSLYSPLAWQALQDNIRSRYTMPQERELFDALMNGENIETVLQRLGELVEQASTENDIELF